jgi:putative FmdB family regulatory protein
MPIYEFECKECGNASQQFQSYTDAFPTCEDCKKEMKKLISKTSFSLKGRGWAKDNYGLKK